MGKLFIAIAVLVAPLFLAGCSDDKSRGVNKDNAGVVGLIPMSASEYRITEHAVKGHLYLVVERDGIIHAEHCECKRPQSVIVQRPTVQHPPAVGSR